MEVIKKIIFVVCLLPTLLFAEMAAEMVNINTADREALMTSINGVGEKLATAIIAYREEIGPFKSVAELANVRGIGPSLIEKNADVLVVEEPMEQQSEQQ